MGARVIPLRGGQVSQETVDALKYLLHEAKAARITGIAFAALHQDFDYSTGVVGDCLKIPVLTRGMIAALKDEVSDLMK